MKRSVVLVIGLAIICLAIQSSHAQDQVGAPKNLTPQIVKNAVGLVKEGKRYSLARTLEIGIPTHPFHHPLFYTTYRTIPESLKMFAEYENQVGGMNERVELVMHTGTHLDALNHISRGMKMYGGYDAGAITGTFGTSALGVENVPPLVTRGVLVDVAGLKGAEHLDKGYAITPKDIEDALARQGVTGGIQKGDVVLFYTGWGAKWWMKDNAMLSSGDPGAGVAAARYLAEKGIVATGSDTVAFEVVPFENPKRAFEAHQILLVDNGIHIMENLKTEELARDKVYEFLFVALPLPLKGGTGSPIHPVASHP
jgi:kynurenine formamidase